jgi:hypothetical protein
LREADETLVRQIRYKPGKQTIHQTLKGLCAEAGVRLEELCEGSQRRAVAEVRAKAACRLNRDGNIHGRDCALFRGGGIGDRHGDPQGREGKITLMILSNVPLSDIFLPLTTQKNGGVD